MEYIGTYTYTAPFATTPPVAEATERHVDEFYRRPANVSTGFRLGYYTGRPLQRCAHDGQVLENEALTEWEIEAVGTLCAHVKAAGAHFPDRDHSDVVEIAAGYSAFISGDGASVVAETYVSNAGNCVILIHRRAETTLAISSRRHGIPMLAAPFAGRNADEISMYDSRRPDRAWWEYDLENVA